MPPHIKVVVSILACLAAGAAYYFGVEGGWALIVLPALMVFGIWAFPEPRRPVEEEKPDAGESKSSA